jgi:predicted AAA+ superfamily ATPase
VVGRTSVLCRRFWPASRRVDREEYWETGGFPCVDHDLVTSVSSGILVNSGHLLENLVFTALRRLHPEIYYYKTKTGREVDFIVPMRGRSRMLVQVCESLAEPQTRKRETAALGEAMAELGLKAGTVVTRNEDERIDIGGGTIEVIPAWRYLLDQPTWHPTTFCSAFRRGPHAPCG